jgi:5-methylcytosine-specific restriction endonuclease McrA
MQAHHVKNQAHIMAKAVKWVTENRAKHNAKCNQWAKQNKPKVNARTARRYASKTQATPKWLTPDDHWMIEQAYEIAALRTKMFGVSWEVDHIIPLRGKTVSGLHTPWNLQVVTQATNRRKSNSFQGSTC